jgi:uncharacterized protein
MVNKIIIAGGTGFLGHSIIRHLHQIGNIDIVVLTRRQLPNQNRVRYVQWDARTISNWAEELEGSTAVINLVGKSINCRYTAKNKESIIASRVEATSVIGQATLQATEPPAVWINAGSAAIFGDGGTEVKDENAALGNGFSAEVCKHWEAAFNQYHTPFTRKVLLRAGLVFQKYLGLLYPFANLVKFGLGGTIGAGNQYVSWIHENDFVNIVEAAIFDSSYKGVIHCTSPGPVTNKHFMKALRTALQVPFGIPNPASLVRLGAVIMQTEAELVLSGRRVVSNVLKQKNFVFQYPQIETALQQLLTGKALLLA